MGQAVTRRHNQGYPLNVADRGGLPYVWPVACNRRGGMDDLPATISVKRAARLLGLSPDVVRDYLRRGVLVGTKERGAWVVTVKSVQVLLTQREAAAEVRRKGLGQSLAWAAEASRLSAQQRERRRNQGLE